MIALCQPPARRLLRSVRFRLLQIGDRAQGCAADFPCVLCQRAAARIRFRGFPGFAARFEFRRTDVQADLAALRIDRDGIAGLNQG